MESGSYPPTPQGFYNPQSPEASMGRGTPYIRSQRDLRDGQQQASRWPFHLHNSLIRKTKTKCLKLANFFLLIP
jgi:hypothetical protein